MLQMKSFVNFKILIMKITVPDVHSMARKAIFSIALLFTFTFASQAQDYKSAIGLKFGAYTGVDFKTFVSSNSAIELIGVFRSYTGYKFFNLGALYEVHNKFDVPGLRWYYGGGGFVGLYSFDSNFSGSQGTAISIAGVLGLEYRIGTSPITLSLDWVPSIAVSGGGGFAGDGGGLAVRYIFN